MNAANEKYEKRFPPNHGITFFYVMLKDHPREPLVDYFDDVCRFVENARSKNGKVRINESLCIFQVKSLILNE